MSELRIINALRADKENNNTLLSPVDTLLDLAEDISTGKVKCDKLLVVALDTGDGHSYNTHIRLRNMRVSEAIALVSIAKAKLLSWMKPNDD